MKHQADCKWHLAATCPVAVACDEHGHDVCPKCDPCNCRPVCKLCLHPVEKQAGSWEYFTHMVASTCTWSTYTLTLAEVTEVMDL